MEDVIQRQLKEIYMHTSNGQKYYPFEPKPKDVHIDVIAHHLANKARWAGATQHPKYPNKIFYSVAEHSVYVADYIEEELGRPDLALDGLLHDGSEAFNGDLIRPLKYSKEFSEPFKSVEAKNEIVIAKAFGTSYPLPPEVKIADEAVCAAEYAQIIPRCGDGEDWDEGLLHDTQRTAKIEIQMLDPYQARDMFLEKYVALVSRRDASAA